MRRKRRKTVFVGVLIFVFLIVVNLNFLNRIISKNIVKVSKENNEQYEQVNEMPQNKESLEEPVDEATNEAIDEDIIDSFTHEPLPEIITNKIKGVSWKEGAPVTLDDLSYVRVTYWGFDDKEHIGELVVHKKVAEEITQIFKELYDAKFPIDKIRLIDEYEANDDLSMDDNNTSAFCFREVAESEGTLSKHSYGIAIDINPVQNPFIKGDRVSPVDGKEYTDRENLRKGMIVKDDICYRAFKKRGWIWGGEWKTLKDYQHFQKQIDLD
ncbi:M15 family metallopeptidase [Wukongibacter sp. M2B1]|uniref:M15 family metallopeptidase n=1 Tax=Wukongibacter sp. M2B1 TaxID=3088895 RepID=UPI003D78EFF0